jgi:diguanylate cyclase (GGDEF)-like protein
MADIDDFKSINDRFGHPAGDTVLQESARRFLSCVRCSDEVGRYGGEEFLIILPGCDRHAAIARAEQFRLAIERNPVLVSDVPLRVTCSFGVHCVIGGGDCDDAVLMADAALYLAKRKGRNRVQMSDMCAVARA